MATIKSIAPVAVFSGDKRLGHSPLESVCSATVHDCTAMLNGSRLTNLSPLNERFVRSLPVDIALGDRSNLQSHWRLRGVDIFHILFSLRTVFFTIQKFSKDSFSFQRF